MRQTDYSKIHQKIEDRFLKIGKEFATKGATQLAKELKIKRGSVYYIVTQLRKRGVNIPPINNKEIMDSVAEKLKQMN